MGFVWVLTIPSTHISSLIVPSYSREIDYDWLGWACSCSVCREQGCGGSFKSPFPWFACFSECRPRGCKLHRTRRKELYPSPLLRYTYPCCLSFSKTNATFIRPPLGTIVGAIYTQYGGAWHTKKCYNVVSSLMIIFFCFRLPSFPSLIASIYIFYRWTDGSAYSR